jgi:hypothetical protein
MRYGELIHQVILSMFQTLPTNSHHFSVDFGCALHTRTIPMTWTWNIDPKTQASNWKLS